MNQEPKSLCRCRWCDRNDIKPDDMAIMSFKESYGGFTGVCKACINSEEAERKYMLRMYEQGNQITELPT